MASGFITLPNGEDWSSRWTRYDWVLETIMNQLSDVGKENELKKWIEYILPNEEKGDIESGYCFFKKTGNKEDFECVLRIIDTRFMKDEFQEIFWNTVKLLSYKLKPDPNIGFLMNDLFNHYEKSLNDKREAPTDNTLQEIFKLNEFTIAE